jgi:GNAT superfamily N-acetyltransferase
VTVHIIESLVEDLDASGEVGFLEPPDVHRPSVVGLAPHSFAEHSPERQPARYASVMAVRRFEERDLPLVEQSVPERKISAVHRERLALQETGECKYFVALSNERPVGWVMLLVGHDRPSEWRIRFSCAEVQDLYITKSARRQGLGTELLSFAERVARELGFRAIGLETGGATDPDYLPARRLYEERGYVDVARGPWLVGWSSMDDHGERRADWEILGSYFLKDLPWL